MGCTPSKKTKIGVLSESQSDGTSVYKKSTSEINPWQTGTSVPGGGAAGDGTVGGFNMQSRAKSMASLKPGELE